MLSISHSHVSADAGFLALFVTSSGGPDWLQEAVRFSGRPAGEETQEGSGGRSAGRRETSVVILLDSPRWQQ